MIVYKNRGYIETFPEHARFLVEKSTHEVWVVYKNYPDAKPMERLTKDNYIQICNTIQEQYDKQISSDGLFIVSDISDITMRVVSDSYRNVYVDINQSNQWFKNYRNWDGK